MTVILSLTPGERFEIIIAFTDLETPGIDGFAFTRKVRVNPAVTEIYLAIHSSLRNRSNKEQSQQMGTNDFIPKFTPDRIAEMILAQVEKINAKRVASAA